MTGLFIKDVLGLRKYMKQLGVSYILFAVLSFSVKSPSYLMGMVVLMSSMSVLTAMAYDDVAKWDKYALSMPLSKSDLVASKYLLLITITLGMGFISTLLAFFMSLYFQTDKPLEVFVIGGAICLVALIFYSIIIPLAFKLGVEKSRIFIGIIFGIPALLVAAYSNLNLGDKFNIPIPTENQIKLALFASPFITVAILYLSYRISVGILQKKEF
ncbi:MAG: putative transporter protein [Anaerocolumna sp.]|jgi:hypothetical protein|nr:putative transporter protein [Anaerocolumna sp.]